MSVFMNIGLIINTMFGLMHFFVPYFSQWHLFMPDAPRYIIVSIDWTNIFFSLILTGISALLLVFQSKITQRDQAVLAFYGFLVFIYFCKVIITIIYPWNMGRIADIIETAMSSVEFILLSLPLFYYLRRTHETDGIERSDNG